MAVVFLSPQVALGLAPGNPDIYLQVDPSTKVVDTPAGGTLDITINIISQEGFEGKTQLSLESPPAGVTATFSPNPVDVPAFDQGNVKTTFNIASSVAQGKITLKVNAKSVTDSKITKTLEIALNIVTGTKTTTSTSTSTSTTSTTSTSTTTSTSSTTTTSSTTSTETSVSVTTVVSTTTQVITTSTPSISTKTTANPSQVQDYTLPLLTALVVVVLLAVAALSLRKKK